MGFTAETGVRVREPQVCSKGCSAGQLPAPEPLWRSVRGMRPLGSAVNRMGKVRGWQPSPRGMSQRSPVQPSTQKQKPSPCSPPLHTPCSVQLHSEGQEHHCHCSAVVAGRATESSVAVHTTRIPVPPDPTVCSTRSHAGGDHPKASLLSTFCPALFQGTRKLFHSGLLPSLCQVHPRSSVLPGSQEEQLSPWPSRNQSQSTIWTVASPARPLHGAGVLH